MNISGATDLLSTDTTPRYRSKAYRRRRTSPRREAHQPSTLNVMIEFLRSRKHIALFVMSGFMLTAGSNTGESAYLFLPGDNMTYLNQVIQGTESFIGKQSEGR